MDSSVMALEAMSLQIQQQEKEHQKLEKEENKLAKLLKGGKVTNPLLLIMFLELQGMKNLSKSANPLIDMNRTIHDEHLAKLKAISKLNQQLKALVSKKDFTQADQAEAQALQLKISEANVDSQEIQQKDQNLWSINFQPLETNIQATSNMAASAIRLLNQSRQGFLSTTR